MQSPSNHHRLRSILGGSTGNLVEWYDWYAYSAFALIFAPHFFPAGDTTAQLLNTAAVFAVGFLMRPIGGWVMGVYADRHGRKAGLTLSVTLMCSGSLLIAVAPGYAEVGVLAPVLLVIARLTQGLSVGGEYGASATYLSEMAGKHHRGFFSSFQYVTLISGQLIAQLVLLLLTAVLSREALAAWGWRIPFAVGAMLAVVVFWIRRRIAETDSFERRDTGHRSSFAALITRHPREAVTVVLMTAGGTLAFYAYSIYLQKFLVNTSGFSVSAATAISAAALFVFMLLQPVAGALSDRVGRKPLMVGFGVAGVLLTYPIFSTLESVRSPAAAFALMLAALVIVTGYTAINAVVKAELFPAHIRALGVALPYAIANAVFGGTAEYVALWFKQAGWERGFYWYVTALIAVSLVTYLRMRDTRTHSRIVED
ncbi:MFS transporter, MHS family, alpha-ketoglutarate permease [Sphingomonas guangdongensis]|uniref:MFS transporter, MHS family, alpha-ketoglutarate permease n=1 Tax=Sphingomonas guangdongensis TaxID=1141890 RepID=A0A285R3J1_9SPHN|nr:MFS transporter [Sphingomonas guangdongensis]SOB88289.1 MFS transporter, MHS family, alpha-ketoglutarate permease [Sphingomonas guangdongensis]